MRTRAMVLAAALACLPGVDVSGQSLQRLSLQGSGAMVFPTSEESDFENDTRLGWEGQVRYTFSRFSLGAGYQRSTVYRLQGAEFSAAVSLGFLEPRYVIAAGTSLALYLAARAGLGSLVCEPAEDCAPQDLEPAFGGGGGLLVLIGRRLSLDIGSQFFSTQFTRSLGGEKAQTGYILARLGLSLGL